MENTTSQFTETSAPEPAAVPTPNPQDEVFVISRVTFNYVIIAFSFLLVGMLIGALLMGSQGGINEAMLRTIVREEVANVTGSTTTQTLDPNQVYEIATEGDPSIGPDDALVTVVEFSDFQCGYCKAFAAQTLPALLEKYGNKVRFVYRDYPVLTPMSLPSALAAECADDQGQFWTMHNLLFANSQLVTSNEAIAQFAEQIGLDMETFNTCITDQTHMEEVRLDYEDGQQYGRIGTPTFFINGKPVIGAQPFENFVQVIDAELAAAEAASS